MTDYASRAAARRGEWRGGVASSFEEMARVDLEFWRAATASQRLTAVWQMALDALAMEGGHGAATGFPGSTGGIRSRTSEVVTSKRANGPPRDLLDIETLEGTPRQR